MLFSADVTTQGMVTTLISLVVGLIVVGCALFGKEGKEDADSALDKIARLGAIDSAEPRSVSCKELKTPAKKAKASKNSKRNVKQAANCATAEAGVAEVGPAHHEEEGEKAECRSKAAAKREALSRPEAKKAAERNKREMKQQVKEIHAGRSQKMKQHRPQEPKCSKEVLTMCYEEQSGQKQQPPEEEDQLVQVAQVCELDQQQPEDEAEPEAEGEIVDISLESTDDLRKAADKAAEKAAVVQQGAALRRRIEELLRTGGSAAAPELEPTSQQQEQQQRPSPPDVPPPPPPPPPRPKTVDWLAPKENAQSSQGVPPPPPPPRRKVALELQDAPPAQGSQLTQLQRDTLKFEKKAREIKKLCERIESGEELDRKQREKLERADYILDALQELRAASNKEQRELRATEELWGSLEKEQNEFIAAEGVCLADQSTFTGCFGVSPVAEGGHPSIMKPPRSFSSGISACFAPSLEQRSGIVPALPVPLAAPSPVIVQQRQSGMSASSSQPSHLPRSSISAQFAPPSQFQRSQPSEQLPASAASISAQFAPMANGLLKAKVQDPLLQPDGCVLLREEETQREPLESARVLGPAAAPKILARPQGNDAEEDSVLRMDLPVKSLQEKQKEYAEVRARIFAKDPRKRGRGRGGVGGRGGSGGSSLGRGPPRPSRGAGRGKHSVDCKADPDYDRGAIRLRSVPTPAPGADLFGSNSDAESSWGSSEGSSHS